MKPTDGDGQFVTAPTISQNEAHAPRGEPDIVAQQARLVGDLVDTGHLDFDRFSFEIKTVELPSVLEAALGAIMPGVMGKQIAITTDIDRTIGRIRADPARLHQVFSIVLSNAVRFTPDHGHIRVSLRRQLFGANVVIEDDGTRIDAELLPHIFDRFRHGDGLRAGHRGRMEPGLWIVKALVHQHGGTVWAESTGDRRGASFTIALPLRAGS